VGRAKLKVINYTSIAMSTTIILSSHSLLRQPPDRQSTQEAFHWKLRPRSAFKSDINVGIKLLRLEGGGAGTRQRNYVRGQERNASHRTNGCGARQGITFPDLCLQSKGVSVGTVGGRSEGRLKITSAAIAACR
jgi:hypothetical protein